MILTTKELRQLLKDLAEEEAGQRAVLLNDRYKHFKKSNPDFLERLIEIAWNHVFTYSPYWKPYNTAYPGVKRVIPLMLEWGISPREIVPSLCKSHSLYEWVLPFHPDLLRTDLDKKEASYAWCRSSLIQALNDFNGSYEERLGYLHALEVLMELAFSEKLWSSAIKEPSEDAQSLVLLYQYIDDADLLYDLLAEDFDEEKKALYDLLHNFPVETKLNYKGTRVKKLVDIFRRGYYNKRFIGSPAYSKQRKCGVANYLANWIIRSFLVNNQDLDYQTVYDYLTKDSGDIRNPKNRYRDIAGYEYREHSKRHLPPMAFKSVIE